MIKNEVWGVEMTEHTVPHKLLIPIPRTDDSMSVQKPTLPKSTGAELADGSARAKKLDLV